MLELLSLLMLAFAVSLDSFGVGMTYGMRNIRIPVYSILIIAGCSAAMILVAYIVASGLIHIISPEATELIGGIILISLGLWALYQLLRKKENGSGQSHRRNGNAEQTDEANVQHRSTTDNAPHSPTGEALTPTRVWTLELKKLGLVIRILRTPSVADFDRSGIITAKEAFILGMALAMDAFGAGLGAAFVGYPVFVTMALIATMSSLFVYIGIQFGNVFSKAKWLQRMSYVPGLLLIVLGVMKIV